MRNINSILIITLGILLSQCASTAKVTYDIPANYPEGRRKELIALFEKGKELYRINCSECHGIFTRGKDSIPNFSQVQFDNYSARFLNGDPMNHAVARKMNQEQLNQVLVFLRYRKTNAATAKGQKKP